MLCVLQRDALSAITTRTVQFRSNFFHKEKFGLNQSLETCGRSHGYDTQKSVSCER